MKAQIEVTMVIEVPVTESTANVEDPKFFYEEHMCIDDMIERGLIPALAEMGWRRSCLCHTVRKLEFLGYIE